LSKGFKTVYSPSTDRATAAEKQKTVFLTGPKDDQKDPLCQHNFKNDYELDNTELG
jgi:hypothetical protein